MNKIKLFALISVFAVFANANASDDEFIKEVVDEVGMNLAQYVKLQVACFAYNEKLCSVQETGFKFPNDANDIIKYGQRNGGIYASPREYLESCSVNDNWEVVPYTEKNGKVLKFKCNFDAGCDALKPSLKSICDVTESLISNDFVEKAKVQKGSMTDPRDGKKYKTITIEFNGESKTWMAENLNYNTSGSTCLLEKKAKCQKYGRLYSFDAAKNACPTGWHLSSLMDWIKLLSAVGWNGEWGEKFKVSGIGKKLKSKTGWEKNTNGTDEFGFSVLPGSFIHETKHFDEGFVGVFWYDDEKVRGFFSIYSENDEVQMWRGVNSQKSSVRCVKD